MCCILVILAISKKDILLLNDYSELEEFDNVVFLGGQVNPEATSEKVG